MIVKKKPNSVKTSASVPTNKGSEKANSIDANKQSSAKQSIGARTA